MDLSKAESQTPADRRSGSPDYLRTLLQDLLCFFALLSVALLIVAGILFVVEDVSRMQQQHQHLHHRHLHRDKNANNSGRSLAEEPPNQGRPYFRPHTWIRFFSCQGKQPQQQPEEAEKEEPKQFDQKQQPTYPPVEPQRFRAGGDHIEDEAANKQLDSEPHQHLADNYYRS
ncbi:uncharacterized protein LOC108040549 [Drosophila rhopaloa]|uniref:Uncharacterized protein n=1 Tax=Drosophila rhopaloa TaxID=1041015 RepID=A0ABM5H2K5_DRORH|nr:uncharacterized protein LOC108040549 [Drosophila rhopaloa]